MSVSSQYHAYLPSANYPSAAMTTRHLDDPKTQSLKTAILTAAGLVPSAAITLEEPALKPSPEETKHEGVGAEVEMRLGMGEKVGKDENCEHIKPSKEPEADPLVINSLDHRRTDHEREAELAETPAEKEIRNGDLGDNANVQTNAKPGAMGPPPKPPPPAATAAATAVATAVAPAEPPKGFTPYRLCRNAYAVSRPHASQDLLSLYGLQPLAATVARKNPDGSKRPLRQSYSGKLEGISGKTKVKVRSIENGPLTMLMRWPEEEWQNQKVRGKELSKGLSDTLLGKLGKAMKMAPGTIPGFDLEMIAGTATAEPAPDPAAAAAAAAPQIFLSKTPAAFPQTNGSIPSPIPPPLPPPSYEAGRPKRNSKKRSYHERSFEGYAEGFLDDDPEPSGDVSAGLDYIDDDDDDDNDGRSSGKKRKKNKDGFPPTVATPGLDDRGGSYGVGSLDVGIGAYIAR
ncbi:MAG: hypothetical protein M1829_000109 [Trizodia sp. TS-e1964]|nr:MAG: hypothetical protein M1829_000109 [Trizodia sp. TS-e1964]